MSQTPIFQAPDVYGAVYDYIAAFAVPALDPANIIRGWENRNSLPPGVNDFAVFSALAEVRRGTNVKTLTTTPGSDADGTLAAQKLILCDVQIDFCSDNADAARSRASALELATRDEFGVNFFRPYNVSALHADDPRDITYVDGSEQFVSRWMVVLHLAYWSSLALPSDWFDKASVSRLEDVDVHHKP